MSEAKWAPLRRGVAGLREGRGAPWNRRGGSERKEREEK